MNIQKLDTTEAKLKDFLHEKPACGAVQNPALVLTLKVIHVTSRYFLGSFLSDWILRPLIPNNIGLPR